MSVARIYYIGFQRIPALGSHLVAVPPLRPAACAALKAVRPVWASRRQDGSMFNDEKPNSRGGRCLDLMVDIGAFLDLE